MLGVSGVTTVAGKGFRDLRVWQRSMDFVEEVYRLTKQFPREELYGLTNQLRRAAVSVPSNIAEGQAHFSRKELHHFLSHARGSSVEIETQLTIALYLSYVNPHKPNPCSTKQPNLARYSTG